MHPSTQRLLEFQSSQSCIQRSDEWYEKRYKYLTASDFPSALGNANALCTTTTLINRKVGTTRDRDSIALQHGRDYENTARLLYENITGEVVHELGCIAYEDLHDYDVGKYGFLAGSPDGVTSSGKLIEIKCPYIKEIEPTVPIRYIDQIQGLMFLLDLNECDFIQYKDDKISIINVKYDTTWITRAYPTLKDVWDRITIKRIETMKNMKDRISQIQCSGYSDDDLLHELNLCTHYVKYGKYPPASPPKCRIPL